MNRKYIIYNDIDDNKYFCITDGIEEIDEEFIEFKRIYLSGMIGGNYATLNGPETFFVYYAMNDRVDEDEIEEFQTYEGEFENLVLKTANMIPYQNRISTIISILDGNKDGNN